MNPLVRLSLFFLLIITTSINALAQETYAEKLGFPKGSKVLILHVDDVGMSWDSNQGAIMALEKGVATSVSMMMPCPWIPGFAHYLKEHQSVDAGLHLTLTSEWRDYRWHPLSGIQNSGLTDNEGAMWASVEDVVKHASPDDVEMEIRAQIDRSKSLGWNPTHLDSHMGTLFATPQFLERYLRIGIEYKIPVMFPGGHNSMIMQQINDPAQLSHLQAAGAMLWQSGLPVLDDLHNVSYGWDYPASLKTDAALQQYATSKYIETIKALKPGLTMVIMHCTSPSEIFPYISDSKNIRKGDLLAMTDAGFKAFIEKEKIILTTWREVMRRRQTVK